MPIERNVKNELKKCDDKEKNGMTFARIGIPQLVRIYLPESPESNAFPVY